MSDTPLALQRHFTISELAELWHYSYNFLRPRFENHPAVVRSGQEESMHRRRKIQIRVPESVALEVYESIKSGTDFVQETPKRTTEQRNQ